MNGASGFCAISFSLAESIFETTSFIYSITRPIAVPFASTGTMSCLYMSIRSVVLASGSEAIPITGSFVSGTGS